MNDETVGNGLQLRSLIKQSGELSGSELFDTCIIRDYLEILMHKQPASMRGHPDGGHCHTRQE